MKATDTFHKEPWRHNCAQAVAHKWISRSDVVAEYAAYGGGRAPGGCCGALFAVMNACPEQADEIKRRFVARCGDFRCRELKSKGRVACDVCVDTADSILAEISR